MRIKDKNEALAVVKENGLDLRFLSPDLQNNKKVVWEAIQERC